MFNQFRPRTLTPTGRITYELSPETENAQLVLLGLFCVAIAEFEGWWIEGSISQRHNNPGNIRPIGGAGFRTFEDPMDGWDALQNQVRINIDRGLTLREFFLGKDGVYPGYTPIADNNSPEVLENYIAFVAERCSFAQNIDLRNYFPAIADLDDLNVNYQGMIMFYKPFEGF